LLCVHVKAELKLNRQLFWPLAGLLLAALISINPFHQPHLTREFGIAAWFADMAVVLVLSLWPKTAPIGSFTAGLFLVVPCFLWETPLVRGLLMCCMAFPLAVAALPLFGPPNASFRERLACFFTWLGTREVKRRARSFDKAALVHLFTATLVFAAAMVSVKAVPATGAWLFVRWLAGGIMVMAFAEMVTAGHNFATALLGVTAPAFMLSPYRATSLGEFWSKRWNPASSLLLFRKFFFTPLARRRPALALWAAFLASAVAHVLIPYMAMGKLPISLVCGAFFLIQPLLIFAERGMNVRQWPRPAARAWTLGALTIVSPLFVEPVLQILEPSWSQSDRVLLPTLAILGFVLGMSLFFALGSLATRPELQPRAAALEPQAF
jgi:membrane bound O-acyltransferase family protein